MTDISNFEFKRKFSMNLYKSLRLNLGKMTFSHDFLNDTRGDLYPLLYKSGDITESVNDGRYITCGNDFSRVARLIGEFFPYASYEMCIDSIVGACGFEFISDDSRISILYDSVNSNVKFYVNDELNDESSKIDFSDGTRFEVSCRVDKFDVYLKSPSSIYHKYICTFKHECFSNMIYEDAYKNAVASIVVCCVDQKSKISISNVSFYLDSGVSIADMRPVRYENGDVMVDNGRVFLTVSIRLQEECYQGVLSWIPGTAEFSLVGAIFFDVGDGILGADVASTVVYNRRTNKWNVWYCSFSHGHILAHCETDGDVRFGVNVLDTVLLQKASSQDNDTVFHGKTGDEDPNFVFDEKNNKWYMTVCRLSSDGSGYKYFLFESDSDNPFEGWKYVTNSTTGEETGGSILPLDGKYFFVCGNGFNLRANYRVYEIPNFNKFKELSFNYDDGGFRGWGTILPIKRGTRTVYYHLTFDRHLGSSIGYNWSYGNIYCFEGYLRGYK